MRKRRACCCSWGWILFLKAYRGSSGTLVFSLWEHSPSQALYHLPRTLPKNGRLSNGQNTTLSSALEEGKVTLLHRRLGHPSFTLLQTMYPQLFLNLFVDKLFYDTCRLAKSKRQIYPSVDDSAWLHSNSYIVMYGDPRHIQTQMVLDSS